MNKTVHQFFGLVVYFAIGAVVAQAQLLNFPMDTWVNGTNAVNVGSLTANAYMAGTATAGAAGTGVNGDATNSALRFPSGFSSPRLEVQPLNLTNAPLTSITICGWYKLDSTAATGWRLFDAGGNGAVAQLNSGGNINFAVAGWNFNNAGFGFATANTWIFFAITYETNSNAVRLYQGTTTTPVQQVFSGVRGAAATMSFGGIMAVGNTTGNNRSLQGWMDDFRLYGATNGNSGALDIIALEGIRSVYAAPGSATAPRVELLNYAMDKWTETNTPNAGTLNVTAYYAGAATNGGAGSGVNGTAVDRALHITNGLASGRLEIPALNLSPALASATICGWYKLEAAAQTGWRLFDSGSSGASAQLNADGSLNVTVAGNAFNNIGTNFATVNTWTFYALTYQTNGKSVTLYQGSATNPVQQVFLGTNSSATSLGFSAVQEVGNRQGTFDSSLLGWVDNFKLFGATNGTAGVLSLAELEAIRQGELLPAVQLITYHMDDWSNAPSSPDSGVLNLAASYWPNAAAGGDGSGVSGLTNDRALLCPTTNGYSSDALEMPALNLSPALSSITVCGWYKLDATSQTGWRLFDTDSTGASAQLNSDGTLSFGIAGWFFNNVGNGFGVANTWIFYAISYETNTSTARLYRGTASTPVQKVYEGIRGGTATLGFNLVTEIGNSLALTRSLYGRVDEFRLYGATNGPAGALSLAALEDIRNETAGVLYLGTNSIIRAGNTVTISGSGTPNRTFVLQTATTLTGLWLPIATNSADSVGNLIFTDTNATNAAQYYRTTQP